MDPNYDFVMPFVDTLATLGLRHAWVTPGSRNTPLALAVAAHPAIDDRSHHDERSAAFLALGMARTTGEPVVVACTSGTAAAELLPAAVEAIHSRVPLLLLTADRPPELRDVGAPQAIDQAGMFGRAVKWSHDAGAPDPALDLARRGATLAARAWSEALDTPSGPVHLNLPFREPLAPAGALEHATRATPARVWRSRSAPDEAGLAALVEAVGGKRGLIVAGPQDDPGLAPALAGLAAASGFPVVADPLSQVRAGSHDLSGVVATGHSLAAAGFLDRQRPDIVIRFGALPTSKPLWQWLGEHPEVPQVLVDDAGWREPGMALTTLIRADATLTASALADSLPGRAPDAWPAAWRDADDRAASALRDAVDAAGYPSEPGVAAMLGRAVPAGGTLWTASSMPVRDVDAFMAARTEPLRVLANRGANGIDGFLSTGTGSALASEEPTYLHAGDLSALYDLTALVAAARHRVPVTIVVVNNDGGGIFHFLPDIPRSPHFERHFGTPHGYSIADLAAPFGIDTAVAGTADELEDALHAPPSGPRLVEVRTDRSSNVAVHEAAAAAVRAALPPG